jgi:hypothetical protein
MHRSMDLPSGTASSLSPSPAPQILEPRQDLLQSSQGRAESEPRDLAAHPPRSQVGSKRSFDALVVHSQTHHPLVALVPAMRRTIG